MDHDSRLPDLGAIRKVKVPVPEQRRVHPQLDPVLRSHLHLAPPEPEGWDLLGNVIVFDEHMTAEEYQRRFPDLSKEPAKEPE